MHRVLVLGFQLLDNPLGQFECAALRHRRIASPAVSIGPNASHQTAILRHQIRGYLRRSVATMQGAEGRKGKKNIKHNSHLS